MAPLGSSFLLIYKFFISKVSADKQSLTGQTPHGVLMSPVTGIRGTSALKSFFCPPVDEVFELLSATSDISALPSKTNVFKMVSMSPSDSCTWVDVHVKCMQWNAVNKIILLITGLYKNVPSGSLGQVDFLTRKVTFKAYLVHTSHQLTKLLTTTSKLSGPRQAKCESSRLSKGQTGIQGFFCALNN